MADPRLRDVIMPASLAAVQPGACGDIALVGFPFDEGCVRNGGRGGAAGGPAALRSLVWSRGFGVANNPETGLRLAPGEESGAVPPLRLTDAGDVAGATLEEAHAALRRRVATVVACGAVPFVVGGGNDQSFPNACGFRDGLGLKENTWDDIGVINIDAHLDVRPLKDGKVHSGSPFRLLLDDPLQSLPGSRFCEFAAQGAVCADAHVQWIKERKGTVRWLGELRAAQARGTSVVESFRSALDHLNARHIFVSFDIDSIAGADCPGVSATAVVGLSAQEAIDMCYAAGADRRVKMFDLSEFNPAVEEWRTTRLVLSMFVAFVTGFATRAAAEPGQ